MKKYYCNKCGKKMDVFDMQSGIRMHDILGYGSKYDEEAINLDLCCKCTDELIDYIKKIGKIDPIQDATELTPVDIIDDDKAVAFTGKLRQINA